MASYTLTIPGAPIAQPRPKARVINGHAAVYDQKRHSVNGWKATIRVAWQEAYSDVAPLDGPLALYACFIFPRTSNLRWKTKPMPRLPHTKTPDTDNVVKALCDALSQLAWVDDRQICHLNAIKYIASGQESPRTNMRVEPFTGDLIHGYANEDASTADMPLLQDC